jgi:hypothetical protein
MSFGAEHWVGITPASSVQLGLKLKVKAGREQSIPAKAGESAEADEDDV